MRAEQFQGAQDSGIAEILLDPTTLYGAGGAVCPRLHLQGKLHIQRARRPHVDYVFTELNGWIWRDGMGKVADALPTRLQRVQRGHQESYGADHVVLEFPLDARRIQYLEDARAGGDLLLGLDLRLTAQQHAPIQGDDKVKRPTVWGLCWMHDLSAQIKLTVPRTVWVERVLPQVGYGVVHVIELPAIGVAATAELTHSFEALQRAHARFALGEYDEAVGLCRTAVEPIRHELNQIWERKNESPANDWAGKVGLATIEWLKTVLGKTYGVASIPQHAASTGHFSRLDAQMILTTCTSIIAYVARSKK